MLTRKGKMEAMDEMKKLLEGLTAQMSTLATGQEEMKNEMKTGQLEMKTGQEEMKAEMASVKEALQEKLSAVENKMNTVEIKVREIEENFEKEINSVGEKVSEMKEDFLKVKDKVDAMDETIEQKILEKFGNKIEETMERKIVENFEKKLEENSEMDQKIRELTEKIEQMDKQGRIKSIKEERTLDATTSRPNIKLSTYDGKSSWKIYRTQFEIVAEANGWNACDKAFHLAASLRGDAAVILETLTDEERHDYGALGKALEMRFGEKWSKEFSRFKLKSRCQKAGETLQEFAADIERLSIAAYPECPAGARESFALEYFIDGLRDPEIKKSLRMTDIKDMKSALVHALKCEAVQKASGTRLSIRAATMNEQDTNLAKLKRDIIREISREFRYMKGSRSSQSQQVKCWSCGQDGHLRKNCPSRKDGGDHLPPQQGNM